jgi:cupin fold WbuC family metalloprotein
MNFRTVDAVQLRKLEESARASPRLRSNLNLHDADSALLHRFVICIRRGSYVRPHRHTASHKLEMATLLSGTMEWVFFDDAGRLLHRARLQAGGETMAIEVPPGTWHGLLPISDSGAFLEVKLGPYDAASDKQFAPWAPEEGSAGAAAYLDWLYRAAEGEKFT